MEEGPLSVGQIVCTGEFVVTHSDDVGRSDLRSYSDPEEAAQIARFDAHHAFRPLKTAPNLKTGWQLVLNSLSAARLAIDHIYPAALGNAIALAEGIPISHDLRDVLQRQTGLYAVTKQITDTEASALIADICPPTKCLNHLLWSIRPGHPTPLTIPRSHARQSPLPLLCTEACPLLIGAARSVVKHRQTV